VLHHVVFNPVDPILLVGDSRGTVHCLKLSPNLRRVTKEAKKAMQNNDMGLIHELEVLLSGPPPKKKRTVAIRGRVKETVSRK
jgi:hypothetical protein